VILFEDVDGFNRNAANALLKTLEEPPADTFMMLTSSRPELLLLTIRSRCLRIALSPLSSKVVENILKTHNTTPNSICPSLYSGSPGKALLLHKRAEVYDHFLESIKDSGKGSFASAQTFVEEKDAWQMFCWFSLHFLHQAACTEESENIFRKSNIHPARIATIWKDVMCKIVHGEHLGLDRKAVMLWFFCYMKDVLQGKTC
jgi:hypothetical protein